MPDDRPMFWVLTALFIASVIYGFTLFVGSAKYLIASHLLGPDWVCMAYNAPTPTNPPQCVQYSLFKPEGPERGVAAAAGASVAPKPLCTPEYLSANGEGSCR